MFWGNRLFASFLVGLGFINPNLARANEAQAACIAKCEQDKRNREYDVSVDAKKAVEGVVSTGLHALLPEIKLEFKKCSMACGSISEAMEQIKKNTSKQWDPNHPVVQRCFAESGVADENLMMTNYQTNNCIMNGLREERQEARQKEQTIPVPTPRPDQAAAEPQKQCDESAIDSLEVRCQQARSQAATACDESKINSLPTEPAQANGSQAACAQTRDYNAQLANSLNAYANQCTSAKSQCASACNEFAQFVQNQGTACSSSLKGSYHSSAAAMLEMCNGLGTKVAQVTAQAQAAEQARSEAATCAGQTAASSAAENAPASGNSDGGTYAGVNTKGGGSALQNGGWNTAGDIPPASSGGSLADLPGTGSGDSLNGSSSGKSGTQDLNTQGEIPESNYEGSNASMQLASLPTRQDLANSETEHGDETAKAAGEESTAEKDGAGSGGSAKGRRLAGGLRLLGAGEKSVQERNEQSVKGSGSSAFESPDLSKFLPRMAGMRKQGFDGHGPHVNLFEKINVRYKIITPTLIQDLP